jgi:hypothetical protein
MNAKFQVIDVIQLFNVYILTCAQIEDLNIKHLLDHAILDHEKGTRKERIVLHRWSLTSKPCVKDNFILLGI